MGDGREPRLLQDQANQALRTDGRASDNNREGRAPRDRPPTKTAQEGSRARQCPRLTPLLSAQAEPAVHSVRDQTPSGTDDPSLLAV